MGKRKEEKAKSAKYNDKFGRHFVIGHNNFHSCIDTYFNWFILFGHRPIIEKINFGNFSFFVQITKFLVVPIENFFQKNVTS